MKTQRPKGGAREGAGAKPLGEQAMIVVPIRMQPKQKDKLQRLGGPAWVRKKIDQAKEPG